MNKVITLILCLLFSLPAFADDFVLKSSAFKNNSRMPTVYTCNGKNLSPPLSWENAPANTQSYVLILSSVNWGGNDIVYLWTLYNMPSSVKSLEEGDLSYPEGTVVGINFYNEANYHGPCPPGPQAQQYVFTLYALDQKLAPIESEIDPEQLLIKIKHHILKKTELRTFFSH